MTLDEFQADKAAKSQDALSTDSLNLPDLNQLNLAWNAPICTPAIGKINFFDLKSLAAQHFILSWLTDPSSERQIFLTSLNVYLSAKIDKEGSPSEYNETSPAKETLKKGWSDWRTLFNTTNNLTAAQRVLNRWYGVLLGKTAAEMRTNGENLKKALKEAMNDYQNADKALLAQLKSNRFKKSMTQFFVESIWNKAAMILTKISKFIDEQVSCVNRYDSIYQTTDLEKVLLLNPYTRFYPSEIKAVNMQETADYTDIGITGLTATGGIGIPKDSLPQGKYVGIAQLGATTSVVGAKAIIEALYEGKKIDSTTRLRWKDFKPTTNPEAVVLFALYLIETERLIISEVGTDTWKSIDCKEKKKFIICGFNTGYAVISSTLIEFRQQKKPLILSEDLVEQVAQKAKDRIVDPEKKKIKYREVKNYIFNVIERLNGLKV